MWSDIDPIHKENRDAGRSSRFFLWTWSDIDPMRKKKRSLGHRAEPAPVRTCALILRDPVTGRSALNGFPEPFIEVDGPRSPPPRLRRLDAGHDLDSVRLARRAGCGKVELG